MSGSDLLRRGNAGVLFRDPTMDFLACWLLGCSQQGGPSPGELLHTFGRIRDGRPRSWVDAFDRAADAATTRAGAASDPAARAEAWLAASMAHGAALMLLDPTAASAPERRASRSDAFGAFLRAAALPLVPWAIPFAGATLPAYVSTDLADVCPLVVVIGGGDTSAEDLWFLGAKAFVEAGYAVLVVDLPGQGSTPAQGLHFGPATLEGLLVVLDSVRTRGFCGDIVLCGWSGGGFFTTKAVEVGRPADRIVALVASTPIHDIGLMFTKAMPRLVRRAPRGLLAAALTASARLNPVRAASLAKYDWQFGPLGIAGVLDSYASMTAADLSRVDVPVLSLVGEAEDAELRRQAAEVVSAGRPASRLVTFDHASGAGAHCQVGNLPLALGEVTRWLASVAPASGTGATRS